MGGGSLAPLLSDFSFDLDSLLVPSPLTWPVVSSLAGVARSGHCAKPVLSLTGSARGFTVAGGINYSSHQVIVILVSSLSLAWPGVPPG